MRAFLLWITVVLILAMFGVGAALYHEDNTQDVYNITNNLVWNTSFNYEENLENYKGYNISQINSIRLKNIIYKGIDAMGYITMEIAKWGVEFGYSHPEYNYLFFTKIIIYWVIITTIIPLLILLPIIIALFYVIGIGIYKLIKKLKNDTRKD